MAFREVKQLSPGCTETEVLHLGLLSTCSYVFSGHRFLWRQPIKRLGACKLCLLSFSDAMPDFWKVHHGHFLALCMQAHILSKSSSDTSKTRGSGKKIVGSYLWSYLELNREWHYSALSNFGSRIQKNIFRAGEMIQALKTLLACS